MITRCPRCQTEYETDQNLLGYQVECHSCGSRFIVSSSSSENNNQDEVILVNEHPSGWSFFPEYFLGGLLFVASFSILLFGSFPEDCRSFLIFVVSAIIIASLWLIVESLFRQCTTHYVLTTVRVILKEGWFVKRQIEVMVKDIRGVATKASIFEQIVGAGTIVIGTAATAKAEIQMRGIKKPNSFVSRINNLRQM